MKRRTCLKALLAGAGPAALGAAESSRPIQLHVDLSVAPAKEKEMLHNFETIFRPAAMKFPGYIAVKMLKLRSVRCELPVRADLSKRGAASKVGGVTHPSEGLAYDRKHARVEELHGPAIRRDLED